MNAWMPQSLLVPPSFFSLMLSAKALDHSDHPALAVDTGQSIMPARCCQTIWQNSRDSITDVSISVMAC